MRTRQRDQGFTLLEVMVSLAILAVSLIVLTNIVSNNVRATNRAKLMTAATFLARGKMVEIEDRVLYQGFSDTTIEEAGDFTEEGYPLFRWTTIVERVELPTDVAQQAQQAATQKTQSAEASQNPLMAMTGFLGGFMSTLIEPIRLGLQEAVRRVTVRVYYPELGRGEQMLEVQSFMTDPSRLDMAMMQVPQAGQPGQGTPAPGTGTGTGTTPGAGAPQPGGAPRR